MSMRTLVTLDPFHSLGRLTSVPLSLSEVPVLQYRRFIAFSLLLVSWQTLFMLGSRPVSELIMVYRTADLSFRHLLQYNCQLFWSGQRQTRDRRACLTKGFRVCLRVPLVIVTKAATRPTGSSVSMRKSGDWTSGREFILVSLGNKLQIRAQ